MRHPLLRTILLGLSLHLVAPIHSAGVPDQSMDGNSTGGREGEAGKTYIRAYEIYDPRFCWMTPRPFLCEKCLQAGEQFLQILRFEDDGTPFRSYECRPWKRPYLDR